MRGGQKGLILSRKQLEEENMRLTGAAQGLKRIIFEHGLADFLGVVNEDNPGP